MKQYGIEKKLRGMSYDDAVGKVTDALASEGFGVLTRIDVKGTLKKKLDVDFRRYDILGACNPQLAHRALSLDPNIGLLLPCNVVVEELDDGVRVNILDPKAMFSFVDNDAVRPIADEAEQRLRRVAEKLS